MADGLFSKATQQGTVEVDGVLRPCTMHFCYYEIGNNPGTPVQILDANPSRVRAEIHIDPGTLASSDSVAFLLDPTNTVAYIPALWYREVGVASVYAKTYCEFNYPMALWLSPAIAGVPGYISVIEYIL